MSSKRIIIAGMSQSQVCGVRDHAHVLARSFGECGFDSEVVWIDLVQGQTIGSVLGANKRLAERILDRGADADALVLQYSAFSHAYRGIPTGLRHVVRSLDRLHVPVILYLHEYEYPWSGGPREWVWAVSQRVALRLLVGVSDVVAVTTERRLEGISDRSWLPARMVVLAPVSSTLPRPSGLAPRTPATPARIGILGYGAPSSRPEMLLEAVAQVQARGVSLAPVLIGAPGPGSTASHRWEAVATRFGLVGGLEHTGVLPAGDLVDALCGCTFAAFTDVAGPDGRRTSIAACLNLGVPVLSLDGPDSWSLLSERRAIVLVPPDCSAIEEQIMRLLQDADLREHQALRGREFFALELEPRVIVSRLLEAIDLPIPVQ